MVYESRAGEVITLGASSWRIEEIAPRPGHGLAGAGRARQAAVLARRRRRPADRARAGARARSSARSRRTSDAARAGGRRSSSGCARTTTSTRWAAENLVAYLEDEREAAGALPTDQRIVVERFRDELGDWRLVILTPFGGRVHAPWSLALEARLGERLGREVQTIWSDDGIAIRLPDGDEVVSIAEELLFPDPEEVEDLVVGQVAPSRPVRVALPRERRPRAAPAAPPARDADAALAAAPARGRPAGRRLALRQLPDPRRDVPRGAVGRLRPAGTARGPRRHRPARDRGPHASRRRRRARSRAPCCSTTSPPTCTTATRRSPSDAAGALTLDRDLLRELLGQEELRELLDPEALADLELSLQALTEDRLRDDRRPAPRPAPPARRPVGRRDRRAVRGRCRGRRCLADRARSPRAGRSRPGSRATIAGSRSRMSPATATASGSSPPTGVPAAFLGPAVGGARGAAGPLRPDARAVPDSGSGAALGAAGRAWSGMRSSDCWRPGRSCAASSGRAAPSANGSTRTSCACCAAGRSPGCGGRSSRSIRPRSPGSCPPGRAVAPVGERRTAAPPGTRRSSDWPRSSTSWPGSPIPASVLERDILPARVPGYQPRLLDELGALGEVAWVGRGSLGRDDGRVVLVRPGREVLRPAGPVDGVEPPWRAAPRGDPRAPAPRAAPRSTASCSRRPAAARTARSSTRCGISSGRARSRTTPSRRSGRCAGSGPAATSMRRRAAGPPDGAGAARGRGPLVAGRAGRQRLADASGSTPRRWRCSSGTGS